MKEYEQMTIDEMIQTLEKAMGALLAASKRDSQVSAARDMVFSVRGELGKMQDRTNTEQEGEQ